MIVSAGRPAWATGPVLPARRTPFAVDSSAVTGPVVGEVWSPDLLAATQSAPMLVVHDGPDYARTAELPRFVSSLISAGSIQPIRIALLEPGERHTWYGANPAYARALAGDVLPELAKTWPTVVRIGVGASLGALAMLHAQRLFPSSFGGLFLQSGSFFRPELDPQESAFSRFEPVTAFVLGVAASTWAGAPVPVGMTCGDEENLANNRAMARSLARLGYPVTLTETPDAHDFTAWRDAFEPGLRRLLTVLVPS